MSVYYVGSRAEVTTNVTNLAGVLTNGTVVLTVTAPDNTTSTPSVTNDSTGVYHADFDVTQEGLWYYTWTSSGAVIVTNPEGVLYVDPARPPAIISLQDAKDHVNVTTTTYDDEIRFWLNVASAWVESRVGSVIRRTVTEPLRPSRSGTLSLSEAPVVSLTSIVTTEGYNFTYDVGSLYLEAGTGEVRIGLSGYTWAYPLTVTYVAGRTIVPVEIRAAVRLVFKALWGSQRGSTELPIQGGVGEIAELPGMGPAVWEAERLLARHLRVTGMA